MAENKEKELQEIMFHLQMINQQMEEMKKQTMAVENKLIELQGLKTSLTDLKGLNKSAETWSTLGLGTYIQGQLADTSEVIVNVGAGVFMKKTIAEAQTTMDSQIKITEGHMEQLSKNLQILGMQSQALEQRGSEISE